MKHITTDSDAGAVLIGNDMMRYLVSNGYGDGLTDVYIDVTQADMEKVMDSHGADKLQFEGSACGTITIYPYDCLYDHAKGELITEEPLVTLEGRYGVYSGRGLGLRRGLVIFERWN